MICTRIYQSDAIATEIHQVHPIEIERSITARDLKTSRKRKIPVDMP
jgi:hypothetical protein